jgi:hypothetical protein
MVEKEVDDVVSGMPGLFERYSRPIAMLETAEGGRADGKHLHFSPMARSVRLSGGNRDKTRLSGGRALYRVSDNIVMNTENNTQPSQQEISAYAYHLWEVDGRQHGRDAEYWFQAQAQLKARTSAPGASARLDANANGTAPDAKPQANPSKKRKTENVSREQRQPAFA